MNTVIDVGMGVFGALFGRKRFSTVASTAMRGANRASRHSNSAARAEQSLETAGMAFEDLQERLEREISGIQSEVEAPVEQVAVRPKKANIEVRLVTLAWAPYYTESGQLVPAWE
jgi:hypothetical protein